MAILRIYLFLLDSFQPSDISTPELENGNEYISWNFRNQDETSRNEDYFDVLQFSRRLRSQFVHFSLEV